MRTIANLTLGIAIIVAATLTVTQPPVPRCEEDAVIVGIGEFEDGRWQAYVCGPSADDYITLP